MDEYSLSLIISVIFYSIIGSILLVIFCKLKKYRCSPNIDHKYKVFIPENSLNFKDLCLKIFFTTLDEIKQECGEEAHHYLYITKSLAMLITVLCPITITVLLPVYKEGKLFDIELLTISMFNIILEDKLLIAPFLIFIIFIVSNYYIIKLFVNETLKSSSCTNLNSSSLRVVGLPQNLSRESLLEEVAGCLNLPTDNIYVVPNLRKAMEFEKLLKHAKEKLFHYLDVEKFKNKRETIKLKYFSNEKTDLIELWEKQITIFTSKLEKEYKESANTNSGVCILKVAPGTRIEDFKGRVQRKFSNAYMNILVVPGDLNWENIENCERTTTINHIKYTLIFFIIFFVLFTPDIFISIFLKEKGNPTFLGFARNVLMLFYQIILVPSTVSYLVIREKHYSKSEEVKSYMRKFLIFFLFSMFYNPVIGADILGTFLFLVKLEDFKLFLNIIALSMYISIFQFLNLMITQTFTVNNIDLARIGIIIKRRLGALKAVGEREVYQAYAPEKFFYAYEYSLLVTFFSIILAFSIIYPIILIFGCVYLWVRYYVHKYNIMCFFSTEYVKTDVSTVVVKGLAFNVVIFQWFTCLFFFFGNFTEYNVLCLLIVISSVIFLVLFWIKYNHMKKAKIEEKKESLFEGEYIHPLQESCNSYLDQLVFQD